MTTRTRGRPSPWRTARRRRYARYSMGTRPAASLAPVAAAAVTSTSSSIPAEAIRAPPIPKSRQPGRSARRARQSAAPWRSPDASPATSMMAGAAALTSDTEERDAGRVRARHALLAVDEQHASRLHGQHGGRARRRRLETLGTDRGRVESVVMVARDGLDDHRAGACQCGAAAYRLRRALDPLDGRHGTAPHDDRLAHVRIREEPGNREPALDILALLLPRLPRRPAARGRQAAAEERPLVEDRNTHLCEGRDDHLDESHVHPRAGAGLHRVRRRIARAGAERVP